ncbi:hypothetical protein [Microbacterium sp.]|uniref:hypothetical protein n=1 Tax=Microbacterium sp. TaxID=51671 RepID=UPI0037C5100E
MMLVSGGDTEDFSLSYLVTMTFGVVVGVAVNLLVVPPLYLDRASRRLSELRNTLSALMADIADHVERGTVDAEAFDASVVELDRTTAEVRAEVYEADESRKANPRGRRRRSISDENLARLRALERAVFYIRDLADVLVTLRRADDAALGRGVAPALAEAIRACCALVAAPVRAEDSKALSSEANAALERYLMALIEANRGTATIVADELTPAALLRRTIDAALPFVRNDEE